MLLPDKKLATHLEKSLAQDTYAYVKSVKRLFPDYTPIAEAIHDGFVIVTGLPYINTAIGIGLDESISSIDINRLEVPFITFGLTPQVEICPFTSPVFLHQLHTRQYQLTKFYSAYVHPLYNIPQHTNSSISVEPVSNDNSRIWVETVMDIESDDFTTDTHLAQAAFHREKVVCFAAWIDDKPVGASALSLRDGLAILHFTATRQTYQNLGVQTAMIQTRLAYAKAHGCDIAFTTTIPGNNSMRNVLRAGFQLAYTRCIMQKAM